MFKKFDQDVREVAGDDEGRRVAAVRMMCMAERARQNGRPLDEFDEPVIEAAVENYVLHEMPPAFVTLRAAAIRL